MNDRTARRLALLASNIMTLDGGFATFLSRKNTLRGWRGLAPKWRGTIQPVQMEALESLGDRRHATAGEILRWAMAGCPGWDRKRSSIVIAAGSSYQSAGTVIRLEDPSTGRVALDTEPLNVTQNNSGARHSALLKITPEALTLCVVLRG